MKKSPGPQLIAAMKELIQRLENRTLGECKRSWMRRSTGTRVVIEPKKKDTP